MVSHGYGIGLYRAIICGSIGSRIRTRRVQNQGTRNYAVIPAVVAGQVTAQRYPCAGAKRTCRATGNREIGYDGILDGKRVGGIRRNSVGNNHLIRAGLGNGQVHGISKGEQLPVAQPAVEIAGLNR